MRRAPIRLLLQNISPAKLCWAVFTPLRCPPGPMGDAVRWLSLVPDGSRATPVPIYGRQVDAACLAYRYRGVGFSTRTLAVPGAFSSRAALPSSAQCARWLYDIHSLLDRDPVYAPYDTAGLHTLFDRQSLFNIHLLCSTYRHTLQAQPIHRKSKTSHRTRTIDRHFLEHHRTKPAFSATSVSQV